MVVVFFLHVSSVLLDVKGAHIFSLEFILSSLSMNSPAKTKDFQRVWTETHSSDTSFAFQWDSHSPDQGFVLPLNTSSGLAFLFPPFPPCESYKIKHLSVLAGSHS